MMRIHLYCPECMEEMLKEGKEKGPEQTRPMFSEVYEPLNDGVYTVRCAKGHNGKVVLNNLIFELLFDLGINAIGDGYYREAVASITSSLERFYEFFVKVVWHAHGLSFDDIDENWKAMSNQSERQLGAYIVAYSSTFGDVAPIIDNSQTKFRNSVIHKGEIPTREKTVEYAASILGLIDKVLAETRKKYQVALKETYDHYAPHYNPKNDSEKVLTTNHLSIISTTEDFIEDDERKNRDIEHLVNMVMLDRYQHRMWLTNDADKKSIEESYDRWLSKKLEQQNEKSKENEFQVIVNSEATAEDCLNLLGENLKKYDSIFKTLYEEHPDVFASDIMTVFLTNTDLLVKLYYLYLKVRIYQFMLNENPADDTIKDKYDKAEEELREYHKGLSFAD